MADRVLAARIALAQTYHRILERDGGQALAWATRAHSLALPGEPEATSAQNCRALSRSSMDIRRRKQRGAAGTRLKAARDIFAHLGAAPALERPGKRSEADPRRLTPQELASRGSSPAGAATRRSPPS